MEKILKIQSEIGVLVKTETNPFFKSKYMDINGLLEQLLPLLEKYELVVMQPLSNIDGKPALRTIVQDKNPMFKSNEATVEMLYIVNDIIPLPDLQDPQKMGSAITYYRRYALQSLFLLRAEDDDANKTIEEPKKIDPSVAFKNAKEAIQGANNLDVLMEVEKNISKSKNLTAQNKEELSFLANERRNDFDPTK